MPISLSTPEWSRATLLSNVSYTDSECCQLFHSPMELLSCAIWSEFSADTVLSRRLDPLSRREPPEVSSNPNHSTNVLSTTSVADTSQDYRGAEGNWPPWAGDFRDSVYSMLEKMWWPWQWQLFCTGQVCSGTQDVIPMGTEMSRTLLTWLVLNRITFKLVFYRQWHFKSFSYRTVIKSHQIISVTLSRELIGESVMLRRGNQSWIYQLGWEFEMYLGSYSE